MVTVWNEHGAEIAVEPTGSDQCGPLLRLSIANRFEAGPTWRVSVELTTDTADELAASISRWLAGERV